MLVVVDGGGDEYPLAARGVRDGREGRGGIDEVPFDPQVPDAERVGRATDEFGGLRVAGAAEALGSLYTSMLGFPVGIPAISSASIAFLITQLPHSQGLEGFPERRQRIDVQTVAIGKFLRRYGRGEERLVLPGLEGILRALGAPPLRREAPPCM